MSIIEKWYNLRNSRLESNSDQSEEMTEFVDGINRTITLFPASAFLTYEQKREIENRQYSEKDSA